MEEYEVVVAGGGLAALTAGLFAARSGRSTAVFTGGAIGGHLLSITKIEDFPGFPEGVPGFELCPLVEEQASRAGADVRTSTVESLESDGERWLVRTSEGDCRVGAVIVATGSRLKELGVPGEQRLRSKGVSHCASCDAPLFRGRTVGVAGGGDSALQEALELANHGSQVIVFHDHGAFGAQHVYQQAVASHPAITVRALTRVEEILGEKSVEGVRVRNLATDGSEVIELAGIFVYVGLEPQGDFLRNVLELDASGHVPTDCSMRTAVPGLFAAGDIRRGSACQAVAAAGDGATAAVTAHRYLAGEGWPAMALA